MDERSCWCVVSDDVHKKGGVAEKKRFGKVGCSRTVWVVVGCVCDWGIHNSCFAFIYIDKVCRYLS